MVNSDPKPILCDACKATERINVREDGVLRSVVHHRSYCKIGDFCMQHTDVGYRYSYSTCGRPAKGYNYQGAPCCGIHLRAERERAKAEEKSRSQMEVQEWIRDETENKAQKIKDLTGITSRLEVIGWNGRGQWHPGRYSGKIIIDPDDLLNAIEDE